MMECENCGRITQPHEPTGLLYQYRDIVTSAVELTPVVGVHISAQLKVCSICLAAGVEGWSRTPPEVVA